MTNEDYHREVLYPVVKLRMRSEVQEALDEYSNFLTTVSGKGMLLPPELTMEQWLSEILAYADPITDQMLIEQAAMATDARHRALALVAIAELRILRGMVRTFEEAYDALVRSELEP
jgi:hypothetical protein